MIRIPLILAKVAKIALELLSAINEQAIVLSLQFHHILYRVDIQLAVNVREHLIMSRLPPQFGC
jgi:hypothetical protein